MADTTKKKGPEPRRALGRGLDALLPAASAAAAERVEGEFQRVSVERVHPNRTQPRKRFDEAALEELAESIRAQGLIQPLVVRREDDGTFELIAGERRWRAAQRAGLHDVPVVIKEATPATSFELALVENLQRTDLDPLETAEAYQRLLSEHGYSVDAIASRVGKSRSAVANTMRLLQLPDDVRGMIIAGLLSEGHGRALLGAREAAEMTRLAHEAVERQWSVRETEAQTRKAPTAVPRASEEPKSSGEASSASSDDAGAARESEHVPAATTSAVAREPEPTRDVPEPTASATPVQPAPATSGPSKSANAAASASTSASAAVSPKNPNVRDIERKLSAALGLSVLIRDDAASGSGVVELAYDSLDQLEGFLDRVLGA